MVYHECIMSNYVQVSSYCSTLVIFYSQMDAGHIWPRFSQFFVVLLHSVTGIHMTAG